MQIPLAVAERALQQVHAKAGGRFAPLVRNAPGQHRVAPEPQYNVAKAIAIAKFDRANRTCRSSSTRTAVEVAGFRDPQRVGAAREVTEYEPSVSADADRWLRHAATSQGD